MKSLFPEISSSNLSFHAKSLFGYQCGTSQSFGTANLECVKLETVGHILWSIFRSTTHNQSSLITVPGFCTIGEHQKVNGKSAAVAIASQNVSGSAMLCIRISGASMKESCYAGHFDMIGSYSDFTACVSSSKYLP
jgi:hypothetical protein